MSHTCTLPACTVHGAQEHHVSYLHTSSSVHLERHVSYLHTSGTVYAHPFSAKLVLLFNEHFSYVQNYFVPMDPNRVTTIAMQMSTFMFTSGELSQFYSPLF